MFAMATSVGVTMGICGEDEMCTGDEGTIPILSSVFVLIFVAFFQCGPGPIPMFIASELFDDLLRYLIVSDLVQPGPHLDQPGPHLDQHEPSGLCL